jgi:hypothetical protein
MVDSICLNPAASWLKRDVSLFWSLKALLPRSAWIRRCSPIYYCQVSGECTGFGEVTIFDPVGVTRSSLIASGY